MTDTKPKKYVRLTSGNALWREEKTGFSLSALSNTAIVEVSTIPEDALPSVQKGVDKGILEYVKSSKTPVTTSSEKAEPLVKTDRKRLKWTDEGQEKTGKVLKTPSFTNRTFEIDSDNPLDKQAFSLLSQASKVSLKELVIVLSKLDNKKDKVEFLSSCWSIEKSGANPVMHPRPDVMEYLDDALFDLGVSSGISRVINEEPLLTDIKPLKFVL